VLQPFEEAAFVIFTRSVSSKARSTKEKEVFNALLRVAIIFGSTAVSDRLYCSDLSRLIIIRVFRVAGIHGAAFFMVSAQVRHVDTC